MIPSANTILLVTGTRPNFIKVAPLLRALAGNPGIRCLLVHSGQHYDANLFDIFIKELGIPAPDYLLDPGSGAASERFGQILVQFEEIIKETRPDMVFVVGDVDTTLAAALVSRKAGIRLAHLEAGLRSGDRRMPEEINRIMTDSIADHLLSTGKLATDNLLAEGHPVGKTVTVGNIMIVTLWQMQGAIQRSTILDRLGLKPGAYALLTMHRPGNVDSPSTLKEILEATAEIAAQMPLVFPIHPRTRKNLKEFGLWDALQRQPGIILQEPLGYLDFGKLVSSACFVLTDSGGIQEETTVYGIPCITLRDTTERPETVSLGTSMLAGSDSKRILELSAQALSGNWPKGHIPPLWDGKTAERIVEWLEAITPPRPSPERGGSGVW